MKTARVNRYMCDFCIKGLLSKYYMRRHELECPMNPDRSCKECKHGTGEPKKLQELKEAIGNRKSLTGGDDRGFAEDAAETLHPLTSCEDCKIAALRQCGFVSSYQGAQDALYGDNH